MITRAELAAEAAFGPPFRDRALQHLGLVFARLGELALARLDIHMAGRTHRLPAALTDDSRHAVLNSRAHNRDPRGDEDLLAAAVWAYEDNNGHCGFSLLRVNVWLLHADRACNPCKTGKYVD